MVSMASLTVTPLGFRTVKVRLWGNLRSIRDTGGFEMGSFIQSSLSRSSIFDGFSVIFHLNFLMLGLGTIVMLSSFSSAGVKTPDLLDVSALPRRGGPSTYAAELLRRERWDVGKDPKVESLTTEDMARVSWLCCQTKGIE